MGGACASAATGLFWALNLSFTRLFQNPGSRRFFSLSSIGWRRGPGRGGWKGVGSDQNNRATPPEPDHSSPCPLLSFRRRGEGGRRPHEVLKRPLTLNRIHAVEAGRILTQRRSGRGEAPEWMDNQAAPFWWPSLPQPWRNSASSAPLCLSRGSIFNGIVPA